MFQDSPQVERGLACSPIQESKRDQLTREKAYHLSRIEDIDKVLGLFDKYPETENLIDLLRRV